MYKDHKQNEWSAINEDASPFLPSSISLSSLPHRHKNLYLSNKAHSLIKSAQITMFG